MSKVWTETWLKSLVKKPPDRRRDYTEQGRKGLMLRHHPGGALTFMVRYHRGAEQVPVTLGNYPSVSLEQAHHEHAEIRRQLAQGLDPAEERVLAVRERQRAREQRIAGDAVTVRNIVAEFGWHYCRRERKHPREAVRLLKVYVADPWKGRPVRDLTKRDAVLLLDRIKARAPVMANRAYNLALQAFTFAIRRDLISNNPFLGVGRPGGDEEPRDRKLDTEEIRAFWRGLESKEAEISKPVRQALKLILVTAQRPGEVAGAAWSEIDTEGALWTIPAHKSKNARAHRVPLSPLAIELIEDLRELADGRPHLLPSVHSKLKPDEPLSQRALSRALRNNHDDDGKLFGLEPFTPHDLRRTAASMMTTLGIQRLHVSKVLNHTDQDVTGKVYDLNEYAAEKAKALTVWADELRTIIAGKERKVVPIRPGAAA
jgi:integrase